MADPAEFDYTRAGPCSHLPAMTALPYRPEIDGLRALAVLGVILFHAGVSRLSGGYVGVDVFFVISGYLITGIILTEQAAGTFTLASFYERRARRILPALFVVMAATLPLAWLWLLPADMRSFSQSLMAVAGFVSNILFWSERGYFGTALDLKPLIHTWSLSLEEQYYLVTPVLLILLARWRRRTSYLLLTLAGLASLGLCLLITRLHVDTAFYWLPTRFWELLLGAGAAFYGIDRSRPPAGPRWLRQGLAAGGLLMIAGAMTGFDSQTAFPGSAALLPTLGTLLLILFATPDTATGRLLTLRPVVGLGLISYSAYLWHQPLFAMARHQQGGDEPAPAVMAGLMLLTLALAWLSWRHVERPWRNRSRFSRRQVFAGALAGLFFFAGIGAAGWLSQGWLLRYPPADRPLLSSTIAAGDYVPRRFDALKNAPFTHNGQHQRILLIGDSYAKDIVNALAEAGLSDRYALSTHQINGECGNLYLTQDFTDHIPPAQRPRCTAMGWYDDPQLIARIEQADAIWLASSWNSWVAPLVADSVHNLTERFHKPVLVFGPKSLGTASLRDVLALTPAQRQVLRLPPNSEVLAINTLLRTHLPPEPFIDLMALLCPDPAGCPAVIPDGALLSFDGGHLTQAGARWLGQRLAGQLP